MITSPRKPENLGQITAVILGDIAVFILFVLFGKAEHGVSLSEALFRTALPFGIIWLISSPWLEAYKASTLTDLRTMLRKIPLIWLLCGLVGLFARTVLTGQSLIMSFALVAIIVQGVLLLSWRAIFLLVIRWLSNR